MSGRRRTFRARSWCPSGGWLGALAPTWTGQAARALRVRRGPSLNRLIAGRIAPGTRNVAFLSRGHRWHLSWQPGEEAVVLRSLTTGATGELLAGEALETLVKLLRRGRTGNEGAKSSEQGGVDRTIGRRLRESP